MDSSQPVVSPELNDEDIQKLSLLDGVKDLPTETRAILDGFKDKKSGITEETLHKFGKHLQDMECASSELAAIREILLESNFEKKKVKGTRRFKPCAVSASFKNRVAHKARPKTKKEAANALLQKLLRHIKTKQ